MNKELKQLILTLLAIFGIMMILWITYTVIKFVFTWILLPVAVIGGLTYMIIQMRKALGY